MSGHHLFKHFLIKINYEKVLKQMVIKYLFNCRKPVRDFL